MPCDVKPDRKQQKPAKEELGLAARYSNTKAYDDTKAWYSQAAPTNFSAADCEGFPAAKSWQFTREAALGAAALGP